MNPIQMINQTIKELQDNRRMTPTAIKMIDKLEKIRDTIRILPKWPLKSECIEVLKLAKYLRRWDAKIIIGAIECLVKYMEQILKEDVDSGRLKMVRCKRVGKFYGRYVYVYPGEDYD